jgi:quercetin dioxygenase-like cupin family protein
LIAAAAGEEVDMGRVRIVDAAERVSSQTPATGADGAIEQQTYLPIDGEPMLVFQAAFPPGAVVAPHAHVEDEVLVILDGAITIGDRTLGSGGCVFIERDTAFGFEAAGNGCTLLAIRPSVAMTAGRSTTP